MDAMASHIHFPLLLVMMSTCFCSRFLNFILSFLSFPPLSFEYTNELPAPQDPPVFTAAFLLALLIWLLYKYMFLLWLLGVFFSFIFISFDYTNELPAHATPSFFPSFVSWAIRHECYYYSKSTKLCSDLLPLLFSLLIWVFFSRKALHASTSGVLH